jgi:large subunit ribosomal protein L21e
MRHSRGFRSRTRQKLSGGRFSIREALQEFKEGETVRVKINPAIHKGMPNPRFQGSIGTITGKRGKSFLVELKSGGKAKQVVSKPEHLSPL